ncbi:MAG: 3'(2'),5'-bisphosphate nucleotidase [Bacteroidetes bacterium]|nr:MAG: 3'(2'),5'-bisphosphate nucleotidase [Bacteroidota bacterium]
MQLSSLIPDLVRIAREAGSAILSIYADHERFVQVEHKADDSPLTLADRLAHQVIAERLGALTPDIPLLSEEGQAIPYELRSQWQRFWLVDPLDGTKEFIKRNGEFTVNIALIEGGRPVLGCVYVPAQDLTYYAFAGGGAFRMENNFSYPIVAEDFNPDLPGIKVVASRSHMTPEAEDYISRFSQPHLMSMGSSLKFLLVAEGKAHVYPRLGPTMEWDTAAAQMIVEEAGGSVISQDNGEPLSYNKMSLLNPHFIVYGRKV